MPLRGWTNSWDVAATGVYRPGVEQAHEDQLARLREEEPTVFLDSTVSPIMLLIAVIFVIVVVCFIFFPEQIAAIYA